MKFEFSRRFSKNTQTLNFIKIRPVGAKLFHADRETDRQTDKQTDTTTLIVAFRNFANAPKTAYVWWPNECCTNNSGRAYRPASSCVLIR